MTGVRIRINGIVQGIGFRPFIHRLAEQFCLAGMIRNTAQGVELEMEGRAEDLRLFLDALRKEKPALALIEQLEEEIYSPLKNYTGFRIETSRQGEAPDTLVSPDLGICEDCLRELFEQTDRRYRYPFINCTNCGPRFTIIKDLPYDRANTSMASFEMCEDCATEYADIRNRRYHAQPDCCPSCGPKVWFTDGATSCKGEAALAEAARFLEEGRILAVKGLGGFHLACRIDDEICAETLRRRKQRDEKPFAVMVKDLAAARRLCTVRPEEEEALVSPKRPIVLLKKKDPNAYLHISENHCIGIMLPYTPLHYLLFDELKTGDALVMTSANLSDEPVICGNEEALEKLSGIADGFLMHNRPIVTRCDDSLIRIFEKEEYPVRRSRGYVPFPLRVPDSRPDAAGMELSGVRPVVLACGAEQKASFALLKDRHIFPSQHMGDLKNLPVLQHYEDQIRHFEKLFGIRPEILAHDLHPDYLSSVYAKKRTEREPVKTVAVQHHHAHMAACMADNGLMEPCIGIIWDGTGLGTDGTIWGGEFLTGGYDGFQRRGSLLPFRLPGGDRAAKQLWRSAVALSVQAAEFLPDASPDGLLKMLDCSEPVPQILTMLKQNFNCPSATSMGRLFDAVSCLLGIKTEVSYEGQGAVLLEACAQKLPGGDDGMFPYEILSDSIYLFDHRPMTGLLLQELLQKNGACFSEDEKCILACRFMNTLVDMAAEITKRIAHDCGLETVVLSGGTFQNVYLLKNLVKRLRKEGFSVYYHRRIAPNDEGLAVGQAMIAAAAAGKL